MVCTYGRPYKVAGPTATDGQEQAGHLPESRKLETTVPQMEKILDGI